MTGSLQIKKDYYYAVINLYNDGGERKPKWISTGLEAKSGNKRKAEVFLRQKLAEFEQGYVISSDTLFSDYVEYWLKRKKGKVEELTLDGYRKLAKIRVIPYFKEKKIKLINMSRHELQSFFDKIIYDGKLDGSGDYSPNSLRKVRNIVNQTLDLAVKEDLIPFNPCMSIDLPKMERFESSYYSSEQIKTLFNAIQGDVLENLIKITTLYGLRRSEVLGIKWSCIDFEGNKLIIKHTVVQSGKIYRKDNTKNQSSRRAFALSQEARDIFMDIKREEKHNRLMFKGGYIENDYVFKWPNGDPIKPDYVSGHFNTILKKNNLPHIRFHELRHSCASMLLNSGFTLKDVQEYMGHADIQMTANIYGHMDPSRRIALTANLAHNIFSEKNNAAEREVISV